MITRVLLDTNVVGNHLDRDESMLDLTAIHGRLWKYRISLADSTGEIFAGLSSGRLIERWSRYIGEIDGILDSRWPIFPGGRELAALAETQSDLPADVADCRYYQAIWQWLRNSNCIADLERGTSYVSANGTRYALPFDRHRVEDGIENERDSWIDYINDIRDEATRSSNTGFEAIFAIVRSRFGSQPYDPPNVLQLYDGMFRMIARMVELSLQRRDPYNPAGRRRRGDVFDFLLLYALPLPAVICTSDGPFCERLRATGCPDAMQVISIEEFNQHARDDTLEELVAHHRTTSEQVSIWQVAAYYRWLNLGQPDGGDWEDWFATEPVA